MTTASLSRLLADELSALRDFIKLLKEEQTILVEARADALPGLIERKSALATRLSTYSAQRESALAALNLPAGRSGMESWLNNSAAAAAPSRQAWQELLPLAAEAKRLNELNGKLLGTHLQHNQQALTALMGVTERAMTYGPDGQTQMNLGGGRIRGSA